MAGLFGDLVLSEQLVLSYIIGLAGAPAVRPYVQSLENAAWATHTARRFDVNEYGLLIAQGYTGPIDTTQSAHEAGFDDNHLNAAAFIASTVPGASEALFLWRLGYATQADFEAALKKGGMRSEWIARMVETFSVPLRPEQLAVLVQRSVVPNQGQLPFSTDIPAGNVPPMPQVPIDAYASAQAYGTNHGQLDALTRIIGLPASPDLAARMAYRKIITRDDFTRAIAEGNTRQEWAPFLFDGFRQIPTAEQFVEAHLRGWIDLPTMYAGTALHGMSQADSDLEFQIHRRPMVPHQIKQALARGATFNPAQGEIQDPYSASAHQGNLGPEWYALYESLAGSYPSLFITNRLVTQGVISATVGADWLRKAGNADEVVAAMEASWGAGAGTVADPHVAKAQTQLWNALHRSYVVDETDDALATTTLGTVGVAAGAIPTVLSIWQAERALVRKQLTPAQLKKAYKGADVNPATGAAWTLDEAIARLVGMGYSHNDAVTFLEE